MERFIPYDKLSKKAKRAVNNMRRRSWGDLDPTTRKPPNPRAYDRQKSPASRSMERSRRWAFMMARKTEQSVFCTLPERSALFS